MFSKKLNMMLAIVFDAKPKKMAEELQTSSTNLSRWRNDKPILSNELEKFYNYGFSIDWLFDENNNDIADMFNQTERGKILMERYFPQKKLYLTNNEYKNVSEPSGFSKVSNM